MNFFETLNALTADGVEFIIVGGVAAPIVGSTLHHQQRKIFPNAKAQHEIVRLDLFKPVDLV